MNRNARSASWRRLVDHGRDEGTYGGEVFVDLNRAAEQVRQRRAHTIPNLFVALASGTEGSQKVGFRPPALGLLVIFDRYVRHSCPLRCMSASCSLRPTSRTKIFRTRPGGISARS